LDTADAAKVDNDRMNEFAQVINGAKDDFAMILHDVGELREKFAQVNTRFQKFTSTADENFSTLHALGADPYIPSRQIESF
jgi:hypothetical protein